DRIGTEVYNKKLSKRRADSVSAYLTSKGVSADRIRMEAHGEAEPVTGDSCNKQRGKKLIACLEPDRRVEVSVSGSKRTN
ncbi:MAG: OmpA family protein, partial [Betaproteobacteria bacterium]